MTNIRFNEYPIVKEGRSLAAKTDGGESNQTRYQNKIFYICRNIYILVVMSTSRNIPILPWW